MGITQTQMLLVVFTLPWFDCFKQSILQFSNFAIMNYIINIMNAYINKEMGNDLDQLNDQIHFTIKS